jgi:hypothetical protein
MAAEIHEITESNQTLLEHILTDLHAAMAMLAAQGKLLDKHDALLEEFRPLIDQYRHPAATYLTSRFRRTNARD